MGRFASILGCMMSGEIIRAFDGSLADAEGLLVVEQAVFDECPYDARQVREMLTEGPMRAWLAIGGGQIVGCIIAFLTTGLGGPCWEVDLLAVLPEWTRRGLATRLIRATSAEGAQHARRGRAVVATDNKASARAFQRAGFRPAPDTCQLLITRPQEQGPCLPGERSLTIHEAGGAVELAAWLAGEQMPAEATSQRPGQVDQAYGNLRLLVAGQDGQASWLRRAHPGTDTALSRAVDRVACCLATGRRPGTCVRCGEPGICCWPGRGGGHGAVC